MVALIYVKCHHCGVNIPKISELTGKVWCILCEMIIPYLIFCDKCIEELYNHENNQIREEFHERYNILCPVCEESMIGLD